MLERLGVSLGVRSGGANGPFRRHGPAGRLGTGERAPSGRALPELRAASSKPTGWGERGGDSTGGGCVAFSSALWPVSRGQILILGGGKKPHIKIERKRNVRDRLRCPVDVRSERKPASHRLKRAGSTPRPPRRAGGEPRGQGPRSPQGHHGGGLGA